MGQFSMEISGHAGSVLSGNQHRRGLSRRIGLVVPNFQMVPGLLHGSNMIALLPSRVLPDFKDLLSFPPPVPVSGFPLHLVWHRRRAKDAALQHVAGILGGLLR